MPRTPALHVGTPFTTVALPLTLLAKVLAILAKFTTRVTQIGALRSSIAPVAPCTRAVKLTLFVTDVLSIVAQFGA